MKHHNNATVVSGGTDLMHLMKRRLTRPKHLISVAHIDEICGIRIGPSGELRIGAVTCLSEIACADAISKGWPILSEVISHVAAPQIRNRATIGGNLLQSPRCMYYRHGDFVCSRRGGETCYATVPDGNCRHHSIFGGTGCIAVHPSDIAPALIAMDTVLEVAGANGSRIVAANDFFKNPKRPGFRDTAIGPGEILTRICIPPLPSHSRCAYIKSAGRRAIDFAYVSVAVRFDFAGDTVEDARVVAGAVAPTPLRLHDSEGVINGCTTQNVDIDAASSKAVAGARPHKNNRYKLDLLKRLVASAVRCALHAS
ncbi:MAG: molybdopterin dehydrogenase [Spirochaetales bacterium]|nr:molybdopterin dehydrogenase [Spirochaetales bacterium]